VRGKACHPATPLTSHFSLCTFPLHLPLPSARLKHLWHLSRRNHNGPSFRLQVDGLLQGGAGHPELFLTPSRPSTGSLGWPCHGSPISTVKTKRSIRAEGLESEGPPKGLSFHRNLVDARNFIAFARSQMRHNDQGRSLDSIFPRERLTPPRPLRADKKEVPEEMDEYTPTKRKELAGKTCPPLSRSPKS
jgi:hypothetical protein